VTSSWFFIRQLQLICLYGLNTMFIKPVSYTKIITALLYGDNSLKMN